MEKDLPEYKLTRIIIGLMFELYNKLGYGLPEKVYQKALEKSLSKNGLQFSREKYGRIEFDGEVVGKYYLDFLVEDKVAVELKVRNEIYPTHVNQLLNYIKSENLKIGLLLAVSKNGVLIKRLINS